VGDVILISLFIMAFQDDSIYWVEVEKIVANPFQPRREFDEAKLKELAESIRLYGILQPLTVTRKEVERSDGSFRNEYELIAGERRLRASKLAGLVQVPVIIRDGEQTEQEKLELAIIENLQREDLNAVDRALAFRQLCDVFGLSHSQVAKKVGRSREYVSNTVRLLNLPDYMLDSLRLGDITEGHARTLLMVNDRPEEQDVVFRETLLKKLSVRELERIVRAVAVDKQRAKQVREGQEEIMDLERRFTETLGTRVSITPVGTGGKITIDYFSPDDLEVIFARIKAEAAANQIASETDKELASIAAATALVPKVEKEEEKTVPPEAALASFVSTAPVVDSNPLKQESETFESKVEPEEIAKPEVAASPQSQVTKNKPEPLVANIPKPPVEVRPVPAPKITEAPTVAVTQTNTASLGGSSLKAQLAALLNKKNSGVNTTSSTMISPTVPITTAAEVKEVMEVSASESKKDNKEDEEGDLYSVNNFTV